MTKKVLTDRPGSVDGHDQEMSADRLMRRVRRYVSRLLHEGAAPDQLSHVLAFIATEMGLVLSEQPEAVFTVVLDAVTQAARGKVQAETSDPLRLPGNGTVH